MMLLHLLQELCRNSDKIPLKDAKEFYKHNVSTHQTFLFLLSKTLHLKYHYLPVFSVNIIFFNQIDGCPISFEIQIRQFCNSSCKLKNRLKPVFLDQLFFKYDQHRFDF